MCQQRILIIDIKQWLDLLSECTGSVYFSYFVSRCIQSELSQRIHDSPLRSHILSFFF